VTTEVLKISTVYIQQKRKAAALVQMNMTSTIRTPVVFPGALLAALTLEAVQASRGTVASPPQENELEYSTQAQVADSEASSLFQGSSTTTA